jgi:hypothetical protein
VKTDRPIMLPEEVPVEVSGANEDGFAVPLGGGFDSVSVSLDGGEGVLGGGDDRLAKAVP